LAETCSRASWKPAGSIRATRQRPKPSAKTRSIKEGCYAHIALRGQLIALEAISGDL
jgi:hypothetical protein